MNIIRRAILALILIAGITPAIAQVPPPVPALPDTERRTTYSITASTCICAVGFQLYGDSTDYTNWIEVFVNGVLIPQSGNWTIASPTGSLGTIPRPITNAVLTFASAQTGTVQIVGARRPRRTSQFTENRGVAARDLNQVITDMVAMLRENWDKTNDVSGRAVLARPGETLALLPVLATRRSQGACFDASGNLVNCVSIPSSTFSAGNGITFTGVGPTVVAANLVAGNGIQITGTNPLTITATAGSAALFVRPQDYGAVCDGVTNDAVALQNMLTGSAGKTIFIPTGTCVTNTTLTMPSNTTITGAGREVAVLKGTNNQLPILASTNATNISLNNFWLQGNDSANNWATASPVGAFSLAGNGGKYNIQYMKFSGFNSTFWGSIAAGSSTLSDITYSNNVIKTVSADIPTDALASNNGNYGLYLISGGGGTGRIENVIISDNSIDANSMCFSILFYGNIYKSIISNNLILNDGQTTPTHCSNGGLATQNSYPIIIYDLYADGNPATNFLVTGNTIINPYAAGIYVVGDGTGGHTTAVYNSSGSVIADNLIDGQTSQSDTTLPRAGIVVSLTTDVDIIGNKLRNGFGGIAAVGQMTGLVNIVGNSCTTSTSFVTSTPFCYRIGSGSNGSSNTSKHILKANYGDSSNGAAGNVVVLGSSTGARFNDLEISDNTINGGWNGLSGASQFVSGSFAIKNNKFGGAANNAMASVSGLTGSPAAIIGNVFDSVAGVSGNGLLAAGSVIHMANNKFMNRTSGAVAMFSAVGACGTIQGTQFNNVVQPAQVVATSLGTANPASCSLNYKDFVENLTPVSGAGTVWGWWHTSTTTSTTHQAMAFP